MAKEQTNLRLDVGIKARAIIEAGNEGIALARYVERALIRYMDGSPPAAPELAEVIARIEALEAKLQQPAIRPISSEPRPDDRIMPDGQRWLDAADGYRLAQERGYCGSDSSFRRFARQAPDELEGRYGLRRLPSKQGDTRRASYEDLKCVS